MLVELSKIRRDGGTQLRAATNSETVSNYAAVMAEGERMPPLATVYDGQDHWLYDGFHRLDAAIRAGIREYECDVVEGDRDLAIWLAIAANSKNALPRTTLDKQRAIEAALVHPRSKGFSDRSIAKHVGGGVDHKTVAAARRRLEEAGEISQSDTRITSDGRTMNVSNINANRQIEREWPETNEFGAYVGSSVGNEQWRTTRGRAHVALHALETKEGWRAVADISTSSGGYSGPISKACLPFAQLDAALAASARSAYQHLQSITEQYGKMSSVTPTVLDQCKTMQRALVNTFGVSVGIIPEVAPDDEIPEPAGGWPESDDDGNYPTELAEPVFCNKGHAQAVIHVLQIKLLSWKPLPRWIANAAIVGVSGCELTTPLDFTNEASTREEAIALAAQAMAVHILRCTRDESLLASRHATLLHFLDWAGEQGANRIDAEDALKREEVARNHVYVRLAENVLFGVIALADEAGRDAEAFQNWGRIVTEMMAFADAGDVDGADEMKTIIDQVDRIEARFATIVTAIREYQARQLAA